MTFMRMVQMPVYQIIHMISMRHGLMPTTWAMHVREVMAGAIMRGARRRIRAGNFNHTLIEMVTMRTVQMAVMQIIRMIAMPDRRMAATFPMQVRMPFVKLMMIPHWNAFYNKNIIHPNAQH